MNYITKTLSLLLILSGFLTIDGLSQNRPNRPMGERQQRMQPFAQQDIKENQGRNMPGQAWMQSLTEEQREQIKTLRLQTHEQALGLENQLKEKRARLQTLSTGDQINAKAAHSIIEEISVMEADLEKLRWNTRMEIRTLLTDEQKVIFDSFHSRQNDRGRQGQMGPQNRKNHEGKQGPKGPQGRQGRHEANNGRGPVVQ